MDKKKLKYNVERFIRKKIFESYKYGKVSCFSFSPKGLHSTQTTFLTKVEYQNRFSIRIYQQFTEKSQ